MMRTLLAVAALGIGGCAAAIIAGSSKWERASRADVEKLATTATAARVIYLHESLHGVPPPVAEYFRTILSDGHPIVRSATATQEAEFFINGAWRPLRATQQFVVTPPGFVWDARINMAPLLDASVRDAYIKGRGQMQASLYGVYSLADQVDKPELNAGALQRFLGEAVWFPTALLPSTSLTWAPRDDRSAIATLRDGSTMVSMVFEFEDGLVASISGDRFKENNGTYSLQPWRIQCREHAERDGMTIPLWCEVSWVVNGRPEPYWRGRIASITYRYN